MENNELLIELMAHDQTRWNRMERISSSSSFNIEKITFNYDSRWGPGDSMMNILSKVNIWELGDSTWCIKGKKGISEKILSYKLKVEIMRTITKPSGRCFQSFSILYCFLTSSELIYHVDHHSIVAERRMNELETKKDTRYMWRMEFTVI